MKRAMTIYLLQQMIKSIDCFENRKYTFRPNENRSINLNSIIYRILRNRIHIQDFDDGDEGKTHSV